MLVDNVKHGDIAVSLFLSSLTQVIENISHTLQFAGFDNPGNVLEPLAVLLPQYEVIFQASLVAEDLGLVGVVCF